MDYLFDKLKRIPPSIKEFWCPAAIIFLAVIVAFWPAFSAGFIWDDNVMLTANPLIPGPLRTFWVTTAPADYFPLTFTTFWLEWRIWGDNPLGYHVINVVIHAVSCIVLWRIFLRLNFRAGWLAALLFAIHPLNVESVAWVAERKNVLAMLFYSLTAWSFIRFIQSANRRFYILSIVTFVLSLLAKPAAAAWPAIAFAIAWFLQPAKSLSDTTGNKARSTTAPKKALGKDRMKQCFLLTIPFLVPGLILAPATIWFQNHRSVAVVINSHFPDLLTRSIAAGYAVWFYLYKAVVPYSLTILYPKWYIDPHSIISFAPWAALVTLFIVLWKYRKKGGAPYLLALSYFVLLLLPVLGFVPMSYQGWAYVADRWQYLALPGITLIVAELLYKVKFGRLFAVVILLIFGCVTFAHARLYHDRASLIADALQKSPKSGVALKFTGDSRQRAGQIDQAIDFYKRALEVNPDDITTHMMVGTLLLQGGQTVDAAAHFQTAAKIDPTDATSRYDLAIAFQRQGKLDEAIAEYRNAERVNPNYPPPYDALGRILYMRGERNEGIAQFRRAVTIDPNFLNALIDLGGILIKEGIPGEAVPLLKKAIVIGASNPIAHLTLAKGLFAIKDLQGAQMQFEATLKLSPAQNEALYGLANCFRLSGKNNDAVKLYEIVLAQKPDHAEAHLQLALVLFANKQKAASLQHLRQAVRLMPNSIEALTTLAWIIATDPNSTPVDRTQALPMAQRAVELSAGQNPIPLDTLGAALARSEDFGKASDAARSALQLATQAGQTNLAAEIQKRLNLYTQRRPYLEP